MAKVLIIDDDDLMCSTLANLVQRKGHEAACATSLHAGRQQVDVTNHDHRSLGV